MFWKFLVVAVISSGLSYYAIANAIGIALLPTAAIGVLSSRNTRLAGILRPVGNLFTFASQTYVWMVWAAYCCSLVLMYAASSTAWLYYAVALLALVNPIRALSAAERRASGQTIVPWLYVCILILSFCVFSFKPIIMTEPFAWAANLVLPVTLKTSTPILTVIGIGLWILLTWMFKGTDSHDPKNNPLGIVLSDNILKGMDHSENTVDVPKTHEAFSPDETNDTDELIELLGGTVREAADAMVAEGIVSSRDQVTGASVAAYLQDYYVKKDFEEYQALLPELIGIGAFHIEAATRAFGSFNFADWVDSMKSDTAIDATDVFWTTVFDQSKDEFIRRACVDNEYNAVKADAESPNAST